MERLQAEPERLAGHMAVFVPELNPDGHTANSRQNARGVDLNRNLPTRDWAGQATDPRYDPGPSPASEPETRALVRLVEDVRPIKIVTIHQPLECVNWNGCSRADVAESPSPAPDRYLVDGRLVVCAEALGEAMARETGYPAVGDIGYPCPGSFGTWAGHERNIATITLELGRDVDVEQAWAECAGALMTALAF